MSTLETPSTSRRLPADLEPVDVPPDRLPQGDTDPGAITSADAGTNTAGSDAKLRLAKLIVQGFKSFADKTTFTFDKPVVGVVGPNGCGKSNVVDAVKWVLGEQSAKSLRGEAMLDVIFNGSGNRPAGTFAEVTLVFDNPIIGDARPLIVDTDEVAVGRQLLRDGTSHYKINGKNARLKDVRDLFLDTGIGTDAYSIIEQGRVAQMLDASSAERRTIFEEAAGISRFKQQKKEAQRKLERTDANLLRLGDIVDEVEKQLRSVKMAAGKARNYKELSGRLVELRLRSALHDYHELTQKQAGLEKQRDDAQFELDDATDELQRAELNLGEKREELERLTVARQQAETAVVQTRGKVEQSKQRQSYAARQIEQIAEQGESLTHDREESTQLLEQNELALRDDRNALASATHELDQAQATIESKHEAHKAAKLRAAEVTQQLEQTKAAILQTMNRIAAADRRLSGIEVEQQNAGERQQKLKDRTAELDRMLDEARQQRDDHARRVEHLQGEQESKQGELEDAKQRAQNLGQSLSEIGESLSVAREKRSALQSQRRVLEDLEAKREGVSEAVQSVLSDDETFGFIRGLVADVLRVDLEHAMVIEAALDGRDGWLVADAGVDLEQYEQAFADLPGRVNVVTTGGDLDEPVHLEQRLTADRVAWPKHDIPVRLATDLIRCDAADRELAERLLGRTIIVPNLAEALHLHQVGPAGIRFVTRNAEVLEADGTFRAGPLNQTMGLLSRRSELEALGHRLVEADADIASLQFKLQAGQAEQSEIERDVSAIRDAIFELNTQKVEAGEKLSASEDRVAAAERELPAVEKELNELADRLGHLSEEQHKLSEQQAADRQQQADREATVESLQGEHETLAKGIAAAAEALTEARIAAGQAQEQQIAARRSVDRHEARKKELQGQLDRIAAAIDSLAERQETAEREQIEAGQAVQRLEAQVAQEQSRVDDLTASGAVAKSLAAEAAASVDAAVERRDASELQHRDAEGKLAQLAVRLEGLITRVQEDSDFDLPTRYAEAAEEQGGEYQPEDEDWAAIAEEIKDLRGRIARLGNVNLDAIDELAALESRQQELADQLSDLVDSKAQLEELIETINNDSGEKFEQTFNLVRDEFQTMFRKLFGGGRADIYLQTEVEERRKTDDGKFTVVKKQLDLLEAGIEIVARPPGKQPVSISQLSGGEKTMTCVALLMSIFKSKPSPFCILDEVDAALDEANNVRFNRIVEEFLGTSQFIIITHSKPTMQIADVLYGVTMQEQGVSKKVEVRFDQIGKGGRITG